MKNSPEERAHNEKCVWIFVASERSNIAAGIQLTCGAGDKRRRETVTGRDRQRERGRVCTIVSMCVCVCVLRVAVA